MAPDTAPHPDDPRKPDSPTDIKAPNWKFVLKNAVREFSDDQLPDAAAALTYFTVLSIFPALIALVSILGLFGQSGDTLRTLIQDLRDQGALPSGAMDTIMPVIDNLLDAPAPGLGLFLGLAIALWTASNYVKAFSRAMNRIYEVGEGRGPIKFNLSMYALTAGMLTLLALAIVGVAVSGPLAQSLGNMIGLGDIALTVFNIARWPVIAAIVVVLVALLYWATPNVRQPKPHWFSPGAIFAIVVAGIASLAFGFYVSNFGSYDETYGALAGVIIFLFWINIINMVLLFGAEVDAELERGRQLQGGIAAEEEIQLPLRDEKGVIKKKEKQAEAIEEAREVRLTAGESSDPDSDADDAGSDSGTDSDSDSSSDPETGSENAGRGGRGASAASPEEVADSKKVQQEQEAEEAKPVNHYPDL
ncbi:YihY/virulence factor BrkB family protein [Propioniciclava soli]|uniref:YihY/virulence factor BrkB family protein n=1 Tax=Propioniciclava soli TaxID=2775081 RepID=A0ABZ3C5W1_9ACTN